MAARIHITSAIAYSNGPPHIGHAYEQLATDAFARFQRRKLGAANVTFVTGTDEHGDKNKRAAEALGLHPKAFADNISALFREGWAALDVSYDYFVRTTDPVHQAFVQKMLARTYESGDIYFKDYEGLYCVGCERFYTEKELLPGNVCPVHNTTVELIREGNYFLKLEKHRATIRRNIEKNPDFIRPERYRNEALRMLDDPLEDLCISRPKARLDWGITLPFDDKYVTYVWYDAFWAYVSELPDTSDAALKEILPVTQHFIGKDILKTHAVYWPRDAAGGGFAYLSSPECPRLFEFRRRQDVEELGQHAGSGRLSAKSSGPTCCASSSCANSPTASTATSAKSGLLIATTRTWPTT